MTARHSQPSHAAAARAISAGDGGNTCILIENVLLSGGTFTNKTGCAGASNTPLALTKESTKETAMANGKYSKFPDSEQSHSAYTFSVQVSLGGYLVTLPDGSKHKYGTIAEFTPAIAKVRSDLYAQYLTDNLDGMIEKATWVIHDRTKKPPMRGDCVYFAIGDGMPNAIKIGYSERLRGRMKSLGYQYKCDPFTPLVYALTPEMENLEAALHAKFAAYRIGQSEFFEIRPVAEWLKNSGAL